MLGPKRFLRVTRSEMNLLSTTTNLLLIIFGFGVLIFVHELGHFLAAKWAGIRTEVFAIGMGQAIISWPIPIEPTLLESLDDVRRADRAARDEVNRRVGTQCGGRSERVGLPTSSAVSNRGSVNV